MCRCMWRWLGGWRVAAGTSAWGRAVGAALASSFGVGHPSIWRRPRAGAKRKDVDHVPLGCFWTSRLREIGGWREDLLTNEDFELSYRLRVDGGRVVFDPAIWSIYRPPESLRGIARQYWRYGQWKAAVASCRAEARRGGHKTDRVRRLATMAGKLPRSSSPRTW